MDLEWDVIKAPVGVMYRCHKTFVYSVLYISCLDLIKRFVMLNYRTEWK